MTCAALLLASLCGCPVVRPGAGKPSAPGGDDPGPPSVFDPSLLDRG